MITKVFTLAGIALLMAAPVAAHHPFSAEYDWKKPVTVSGTVTRVDWSNPHAHIYVDAKDADGKTTNWTFELGSINALTKAGWTKDTLKAKDNIAVDAWLSKARSNLANVKAVRLPGGRELPGGSSILDMETGQVKSAEKKAY